ncbi:MAG: T9SS type B sorting domain-containing protein [Bacteroidota bacterium]
MKTYIVKGILFLSLCLIAHNIKAQEVPFTPRLDVGGNTYINIKGDYTFLSNSVMNRVLSDGSGVNTPYNGNGSNNSLHVEYVDIDGDPTTFSSSSSTLTLPDCSQIYWAGLYWAGNYDEERKDESGDFNNNFTVDTNHYDVTSIKFRVPGGSYVDLQADTNADPVGEEDDVIIDGYNNTPNDPYVCYKNVTNLLQALADPTGEYFVANVRGTKGSTNHGVAGWTLVIIYENPTLPGKYISVFDGYEGITTQSGNSTADISVSGFNTIPTGPVNARIGVSVLEGETSLSGDTFGIVSNSSSTFTDITNAANPSNNFFNSTISEDGANVTSRNINSTNSLGYDSDVFDLNNPGNSIIDNGDTSATLRLGTSGDWFAAFLVTFGIEIIEPTIVLEKKVEDIAGNDITGLGVNLGQYLDYVLSFQNTGNDDATNYTIRDVLPINVTLDETNITLPTGVTYVYDPTTREITFTIPNNLVEEGDPVSQLRMRVQVAENCFDFIDACTDQIENLAYSTYEGIINNNQITDDPSVSDFDDCGFTTPGATNFLLDDLENCDFTRTVQLCGDDLLLDSGDGFDAYIWYEDVNGNGQIDVGVDTVLNDGDPDGDPSTLLVDDTGTYIVDKQVADPCKGFQEIIIVTLFGATQTNPITALINDTSNTVEGEIVICPNDGEELPQIFLCGLNDTELVQVNIPDADSIEWQQLDDTSCAAATPDCANRNNSCTWNTIAMGNDFTAADAGEYRLTINYQNGCFSRFYFNIFKNPLDPQYNSSDIICNSPGNITVTNMPLDYEFQLVDITTGNIEVAYNSNPSFDITTNGAYRVEMRQQGVMDGCVFVLDNIGIQQRNFQVDIATRDTDCNGLGEISISVLDVEPQYYYEISQGGTVVDTFGPSSDNNYRFENLNDGVYDVNVTTDDGCVHNEQVTINDVSDLAINAVTTKNIDCTDGIITVTVSGGFPNPDYAYAIWSYNGVDLYTDISDIPGSAYQVSPAFFFTTGEEGDYEFVVVDGNNCFVISNTATVVLSPSVEYTTSQTDETCLGIEDGNFAINVTNSNGYTLSYTLTYPDTSTATNTSGSFTGLPQGNYSLAITQTQGAISCDFIEIFTIGGPIDTVTGTAVLVQDYTCLQTATVEAQGVTGGTAPYEYSIDGVNFVSGVGAETFTGLTNGTYTITVRDSNGCLFVTNTIVIDPLDPPTDLTFSATAPNCPALTSDLTVSVVDGNAPFVFEITSPAPIAAASTSGTSADFNGLSPDTYLFRATDAKGCVYEESFTIAPVSPITVNGQLVSNVTCFSDLDGEARFTVAGFTTSYNYTVTGPATFSGTNETNAVIDLAGLDDGTYTVTVTDNDTNCTDTSTVTINAPAVPLAIVVTETQPTCINDGAVVSNATGGWGSNSFTITYPDGTTQFTNSTGAFNNLNQSGTYAVEVTDSNGCQEATTFILNAAVAPVLSLVPNDFCYDDTMGLTLTASVTSGGDGNFEYRLNGGAYSITNIFTGLGPGTYTVDVRDGNDCIDSATITVHPELAVTASAPNITACGTDTNVDIVAAGGDGNYVYAMVGNGVTPTGGDFSTTNPIAVTGAGDYDVYVRDNAGGAGFCEARFDLDIIQDAPLTISITNTPILCSGEAQATISITASGGEGPYEYSIDNGTSYQISNTFVNQAAGSYTIRVRDSNNCDASQVYTITEPLTLSASAAVTQLAECNPGLGAEVRITNALGGTAPYDYSFDGGSSYNTNAIAFLLPGTHSLFIRDTNGCTFPMTITIDPEPTPPNVTTAISYECDGEGTITVTPDSASFDYTYEIDGNPNTPDTSNIFTDVAVGPHTITVNYISNSVPTPSVLLLEDFGTGPNTAISEIDATYYCYEPQNGTVAVCNSGNGRINDLEYSVTQIISNPFGSWLSPNDASLTPNGRFLAVNVGDPGVNTIVYAKRNIEVIPNRDVEISLSVFNLLRNGTGGLDPDILVELVDPSNTVISSATTGLIPKNNGPNDWQNFTIPPLNPGANTTIDIVIRTIASGNNGNDIAIDDIQAFQTPEVCANALTVAVLVEDGNALDSTVIAFENSSCNTVADGSITLEVENFDAVDGFVYSIDNGVSFSAVQTASPVVVSGLTAGSYDIIVQDALDASCAVAFSQTLTEPSAVVASASITEMLTCTNGGATITASATGGTPNYEYQLEDTGGTPIAGYDFATNGTNTIFTGLAMGDYIVRARDTNNCEDAIDSSISIVAANLVSFNLTPTTCFTNNNNGTVQVDVTGGNGNYQFRLNGGPWMTPSPTSSTTYTFTNLATGTYTVNVQDGFGCVGTAETISIHTEPNAVLTADLTCLSGASITISPDDALGTFSYEWSDDAGASFSNTSFSGANGNIFTTNTAGTYIFRVIDTTYPAACAATTNAVIVNPTETPVITSVVPTHILCHGGTNGSLDVVIDTAVASPPYVIEVYETNTATNYNTQIAGLPAGDYEVTITDSKGCVSNPFLVSITQPDAINYNIDLQPITCDAMGGGTIPGSITVENLSGGTAEYTYHLTGNNGYSDTYSTTGGGEDYTFAILEFGIYEVDVVDANGCSLLTTNIIASPPDDLDIDVSAVTTSCAAGGTAVVSVSPTATGSGSYQFAILEVYSTPYSSSYVGPDAAGGDTATFNNLIPGVTYTFVVYDTVTMCYYFESAAAPINSPSNMTVSSLTEANITCTGVVDGNVTFTFDNYDALATGVSYEIFNAQSNVSTGITGSVSVNPPTGPVTISNLGPLGQGVYYVLLREVGGPFDGCSISSPNFTITQSTNLLDVTASSPINDNCNPNAGVIAAQAQFGTAPYEFQYLLSTDPVPTAASPGWTSATTANVESGNYTVYVKDANDCIQSDNISVLLDQRPEISLAIVDECVTEGSFEVLVTLTNPLTALPPYQLSINGNPYQNIVFDASNQYTITGLSSGSGQTIAVADINGCADTDLINIVAPLQFNATLTTLLDCEVAPNNNAEITIDVTAGSGNYDYEIDGPATADQARTSMGGTTLTWIGASLAGSYMITVYDTGTTMPNCSQVLTVDVPAARTPLFTETHIDVSCNGANDGSITLYPVENGLSPLTYTISPVAGIFNTTTNTFENLPPDTYTVTATGTNSCTTDITGIIVNEEPAITVPPPIVVEFGCTSGNNPNNASLTIDNTLPLPAVQGGTGNYVIYEFIEEDDPNTVPIEAPVVVQSGSSPLYIETNSAGGAYTINIYDDAGCIGTTTATIQPYDALLSATAAITNPLSCSPGSDGEITITVTSTNSDATRFEYSIDNGSTYQTSNVFGGLSAGTHIFLVRHIDTGCIIAANETITDPNTFTIDVNVVNDVVCFGTQSGQVTFELLDATYTGPIDWNIYDTNGTPVNTADDILVASGSFATNGPTAPIALFAGDYIVEVLQNNFPQCANTEAFTISGPSVDITGNVDITAITCIGNDGAIEITNVQGGWGGYSYFVGTSSPTAPGDYLASPDFTALVPGTYEAWVIDINGCERLVQNGIVLADPTPISASLQINLDNCSTFSGEIEVVGATGGQNANYTYQLILNGTPVGSPQTSPVFSGLGAGSYEVLVADQWSCTFTTTAEDLYEEINIAANVDKPIDCTIDPGGHVTISITGGSGNLDYTVTFPDGFTTSSNTTGIFTNLTQPGTYAFLVTDLNTATPCTVAIQQDLDDKVDPVLLNAVLGHVGCNGGADGSIEAILDTATDTNPTYTYELYDILNLITPIRTAQTSPLFENLVAGTYQVRVISGRDCIDTKNETITEPNPLSVSASATTFSCAPDNTVNTSIITVTATDGTAPYLYSIDNVNFQTSPTFVVIDNGVVQHITVYVRDANGCPQSDTVVIDPINTFSVDVTQNVEITCANPEEVLLTVIDNGNLGNAYTFELLPIGNPSGTLTATPTHTTATYALTGVGSYVFRVTDTATGCYVDTLPYEIAPYDVINVVATPTASAICFGDTNGALEINVSGYTGTYDFEVFDASGTTTGISGSANTTLNPLTINGLSGGNYVVRVTETANPLCVEDSNVITIMSPDLPLDATPSEVANVTCSNDQGELLVDPHGGYTPYDIILTNTTTSATYTVDNVLSYVFTGLSAGTFDVQITDDQGCVINRGLSLDAPTPITAAIAATPTTLQCYGDTNATVSATNVMHGEGNYQYQLNVYDPTGAVIDFSSGAQNNPIFNNLGAGIYSITVSDGWNCGMETAQVIISEPVEVMASLIQLSAMTCNTQAQLELTASGGTGPYEYSSDGNVYSTMSGGNTHLFSVSDGAYQYYVRDALGCEAMISNQVTVDTVLPLVVDIDDDAAFINCTGEASATIIADASGGLGNYSYELFTDSALTNLVAGPQNTGEFNTLAANTYYVRVTSQDCMAITPQILIEDPIPLQIDFQDATDVTCSGLEDGTITVQVSGGTGDIFYAITPNLNQFDTVNTFTDLAPGIYDVIAQDRNGCFIPFQFTIIEPSPLDITEINVLDEVCEGSEDGFVEIAISGGTAPYRTAFNSNSDADFVAAQTQYGNLAAGTYVIFVRDAQDCESNIIVQIAPGVNLNAEVVPVYECDGNIPENHIEVTLVDPTVAIDVLYALDSADATDLQLSPDFTNIAPGDHYLTIAHSNGCVNTIDFEIANFEPLTLTLEQNNINEITAIAEGGLEAYTFYFGDEDNGTDNTFIINRTDTYTVRVVDQNGCETIAEIFMEFIDIEVPNFFTPDGDGQNDYWLPENLEAFPNILMIIFDRYGRELYRMGYGNQGWNGIYNNNELPTGDYWYIIKLKGENDDREFVGHFTLYR